MEQLVREILMQAPGAFIRWIFLRKTKTFGEIITDDSAYNTIISFCLIGIVIAIIVNS